MLPHIQLDLTSNQSKLCSGKDYYQYLLQSLRFRPPIVKEVIHRVLVEFLADKQYSPELAESWSKELSLLVKNKLKGYRRIKDSSIRSSHSSITLYR